MQARRTGGHGPLGPVVALLAVAVLTNCGDGTTDPPVAPIAIVGPDMTVHVGDLVQLDGTASHDPDAAGGTLTYTWSLITKPAGSVATISNPSSVMTTFMVDKVGMYVAQLIVNDGQLSSNPAHCTITAVNSAPTANAGPDMTMNVGQVVQLSGAGSSDPDGDNLTYSWSLTSRPAGSLATLSGSTTVNPSFTVDKKGQFVVELVVSDGVATSAPDACTITAPNRPPQASAGPDQQVAQGALVQLSGSGTDPDGDALTYTWVFVGRPAGSTAALSSPSAMNPTFTADQTGDYVLDLTVHDGEASSAPDRVQITAAALGPTPGQYSGTTSHGKTITFTVSSDGKSILPGISVGFRVVCATCSGNVTVSLPTTTLPITNGRFSISLGSSALPGHFAVAGDVSSPTTFAGTAAYRPDPPPGVTCGFCNLLEVTWTASWVSSAPSTSELREAVQPVGESVRVLPNGICVDSQIMVRKSGGMLDPADRRRL